MSANRVIRPCLRFFMALITVFAVSSFIKPPVRGFHMNGYAQGTTYHITYYATDSIVKISQIDSIFNKIDSSLSLYKPYSLINAFNNSSKGIVIDQHFINVVKKSLEIYRQTNGISDMTVKPLVQAWGFGVKGVARFPDPAEVKSMLSCVGSDKIHLQGAFLSKDKPCLQIDLNGIAQGYTVDVIAGFLEKNNIRNYMVEVGGELRVKGTRQPGGERMRIGIESPDDKDFNPLPVNKIIEPGDGAITTSGSYRKYHQAGSRKISHLMDPKSGYPIDNEMISVTVWAKDGITADGYDNAFMGMGVKETFRFLKNRKDMAAYMVYHRKDGSVADTATTNFPKFIKHN